MSAMRAAWKVGTRGAYLAGKCEVRCGRDAHAGDHMGHTLVGVDVAADHVDEVDRAGLGQAARDLEAFLEREPAAMSSSITMPMPTT
jgi:hypothetical protein